MPWLLTLLGGWGLAVCPASAHPPASIRTIILDAEGAGPQVLRSDNALAFRQPDGDWALRCGEALANVPGQPLSWLEVGDGHLLFSSMAGTALVGPRGCPSGNPPIFEKGWGTLRLTRQPGTSSGALLLVGPRDPAAQPFRLQVWSWDRATDRLAAVGPPLAAVRPTAMRAAGDAQTLRVWVSGTLPPSETAPEQHGVWTLEGSQEWRFQAVDLSANEYRLRLLKTDPGREQLLAATSSGYFSDAPDRLLLLDTRSQTVDAVWTARGISDLIETSEGRLLVASEEGLAEQQPDGSFRMVSDQLSDSLVEASSATLWTGGRSNPEGVERSCEGQALASSNDGGRSWTPELRFWEIDRPLLCGDDNDLVCETGWMHWSTGERDTELLAQCQGNPASTGCTVGRRGPPAWIPLLLLGLACGLLLRRRQGHAPARRRPMWYAITPRRDRATRRPRRART